MHCAAVAREDVIKCWAKRKTNVRPMRRSRLRVGGRTGGAHVAPDANCERIAGDLPNEHNVWPLGFEKVWRRMFKHFSAPPVAIRHLPWRRFARYSSATIYILVF